MSNNNTFYLLTFILTLSITEDEKLLSWIPKKVKIALFGLDEKVEVEKKKEDPKGKLEALKDVLEDIFPITTLIAICFLVYVSYPVWDLIEAGEILATPG